MAGVTMSAVLSGRGGGGGRRGAWPILKVKTF